jgi:inner membrane protein involved in colicin E2 resistance
MCKYWIKKEKRKVGVYSMPIPHTNLDVHGQTE